MQNASVTSEKEVIAADLNCSGCGRPLVKDGQFKCLRCNPKRLVSATLGQKAIVCPRHREPVVLMRNNRAYCQNRSCPNYKQRIGTLIKPKGAEMKKNVVQEKQIEKPSKTQEFRDWLEKEIERVNEDLMLLAGIEIDAQSGKEVPVSWSSIRYAGLTSDERAKKVAEDQAKVQQLKQYGGELYNAKDLNPVDIDGIEAVLGKEVIISKGYHTLYGQGIKIIVELTDEVSGAYYRLKYSLSDLINNLEIEISARGPSVAAIRLPGRFVCQVFHPYTKIEWFSETCKVSLMRDKKSQYRVVIDPR